MLWVFGHIKLSEVYFCLEFEKRKLATMWLTLNDGLRAACSRTMALEMNVILNKERMLIRLLGHSLE